MAFIEIELGDLVHINGFGDKTFFVSSISFFDLSFSAIPFGENSSDMEWYKISDVTEKCLKFKQKKKTSKKVSRSHWLYELARPLCEQEDSN